MTKIIGADMGAVKSSDYKVITLEHYEPNVGAPFKVALINSVRQKISKSEEVLETIIPNMGGLLKEVALARALCNKKLLPAEIRFLRKSIGLKASELATLLGITPEHLSRCENGDRALSVAAEKLLRIIILKRRFDYAAIREKIGSCIEKDVIATDKMEKFRDLLRRYDECVSNLERAIFELELEFQLAGEHLSFEFTHSDHHLYANENSLQDEEDEWKRAA